MIRIEKVTDTVSIVRFYAGPTEDPFAPFVGVCTLVNGARLADVKGMHGAISMRHLALLTLAAHEMGIGWLYAERAPGHLIPFGTRQTNGTYVIHVVDALYRAERFLARSTNTTTPKES